jgi:peptide/nickel transport system substrate-binding protein
MRVILAGLLALAVALPALAQGTIRVRLNADIRSIDPGVNRDANTDGVVLHMVEGLVAFTDSSDVAPLLADKVEVDESGTKYTFTLRQGVRFHNAAPLTAAEVLWTWRRYLDPATQWRCLPDFDGRGIAKITGIDAPNAATVVFTLEKPTALFLATMARADCGMSAILHPDSLGADGKLAAPIGTGPFRMGEWRRGQYIELTRFDGYAARTEPRTGYTGNKTPLVDRVRFVVIPDASAARAALLSGAVEVLTDVPNSDIPELRRRSDVRVDVVQAMGMNAILFQTRDPVMRDVRLRRALAVAIDLPELVRAVSDGLSEPNASVIPSASAFHQAAQKEAYRRDLAEARRLLREAGYQGQRLKMLTTRRYSSVFDQSVLVQAMAAEAGINIELEVLDWATLLDRYVKGDYQLMSFTYSARLDPSLSFEMITGPKDSQPRKVYDEAAVHPLLAQSMAITDRGARQELFDRMHRMMLAHVPLIVLLNGSEVSAVRANVEGYANWAAGQPRLWGVRLK